MTLATVFALILTISGVFATYNYDHDSHWEFNGCKLEITSSQLAVAENKRADDEASYHKKEVWGLIQKWWKDFKNSQASKKHRIFEGDCADGAYRKCRTCADEDSMENCIKNGKTERCSAGQDACIVDVVLGRYYRRCGHMCECKPNVPFGYEGNDWRQYQLCQRAGCESEYGCRAVGCYNETALVIPWHETPPPNSAFDSDGTICRCDAHCQRETADPTLRCCHDVCLACGMEPAYMADQCMGGTDK